MVLVPTGNNELSAWASYDERTYYQAVSTLAGNYNIDSISPEALRLLGRVDSKGRSIILPHFEILSNNFRLVNLDNSGNAVGLDIVSAAFDKLRNRMSQLSTQGRISSDSIYSELVPTNSYLPWDVGFRDHLQEIVDSYYTFQKANERNHPVTNLKDFITSFQDFVYEVCPYTSLTLISYSLSRFSDPLESGMIVEISNDNVSDDEKKFVDYLADPGYSTFVEEAAYYGFLVDKNIPWRLILNPNSAFVNNYLKNNNLSSFQSYIDKVYVNPEIYNFQLFLDIMYKMYDNLVTKSPQYTRFEANNRCDYFTSQKREVFKIQTDIVELVDKLGQDNVIKLYAYVRLRETNQDLTQAAFNNITRNAINFKKHVDFSKAISYIEEKAKNYNFTKLKKSFYRI